MFQFADAAVRDFCLTIAKQSGGEDNDPLPRQQVATTVDQLGKTAFC
jgi:hypothetical protein